MQSSRTRPVRLAQLAALALVLAAGQAMAGSVNVKISKPTSAGTVDIKIGGDNKITINITQAMVNASGSESLRLKRKAIIDAINAAYPPPAGTNLKTAKSVGASKIKVRHLVKGTKVKFTSNGTGEKTDTFTATGTGGTFMSFDGNFSSGDEVSGGFFSDLGLFDFSFILDQDRTGQSLTQEVYNNLIVSDLASIGITSLTLANNEIAAVYDIPETMMGGVSFGSTSATGIVQGSILVPTPGSLTLLGLGGMLAARRRR